MTMMTTCSTDPIKDTFKTVSSLYRSCSYHVALLVCQNLHLHCCTEPTSVARLRAHPTHHHSLTTTDWLLLALIIIVMLIRGQDKYNLSHLTGSWGTEKKREEKSHIRTGFWDLMLAEQCCTDLMVHTILRCSTAEDKGNNSK